MVNDRIAQVEKDIRERSDLRDGEVSELREAIGVAISKQTEAQNRIAELTIVANQLRDVKPPGALAFWGPGLALAAALASAFTFVLNERVGPIKELATGAGNDVRELSALYGAITKELAEGSVIQERNTQWLRSMEPRVGMLERRLERLDERSKGE